MSLHSTMGVVLARATRCFRANRPASMTIAEINAMDCAAFVAAIGPSYERSPWVAQAAWEKGPFADVEALCAALTGALATASREQRIALISEHPDLVGRKHRRELLTRASRGEQSSAGMDRLSAAQSARLHELNERYRERFGFPFVICARENTPDSIVSALATRLNNDPEAEIAIALEEIDKIARLRLRDLVESA